MSNEQKAINDKGSYQEINYSLRPAKSVERKMLNDTFKHLSAFTNLKNYQYVGFGSTYFSDFVLIHKSLGIDSMFSIEKNKHDEKRFEFNKPYKCITMVYGKSNDALKTLSWKKPSIIWLDYDEKLDEDKLEDIGYLTATISPGSIIAVTVNVHQDSKPDQSLTTEQLNDYRLNELAKKVSKRRIPLGITGKDLNQKNNNKVIYSIIDSEIHEVISKRNVAYPENEKLIYKQLFNFIYQDGAKMLTIGGVLHRADQEDTYKRCVFDELDFIRPGKDIFDIGIPKLTFREIRYLDKKLPTVKDASSIKPDIGIPEEDVINYSRIYRYFPNFGETEI